MTWPLLPLFTLLHGPALAAGPAAGAANRCDILLPLPPLEAP